MKKREIVQNKDDIEKFGEITGEPVYKIKQVRDKDVRETTGYSF